MVSLTVTDNGGANASTSQQVTVTDGSGGAISLSAVGYKVRGYQKADLTWSGASGSTVEIYRDGNLLTTTGNSGSFTDNIDKKGGGVSYTYVVCDSGECSNQAVVQF